MATYIFDNGKLIQEEGLKPYDPIEINKYLILQGVTDAVKIRGNNFKLITKNPLNLSQIAAIENKLKSYDFKKTSVVVND